MKKAIFTFDYGKEKMDQIRALGYEVQFAIESNHTDRESEGFEQLDSDAEILICYNPFDYLNFDQFPNLKLIQLSSIGVDQVPVEEVTARGIAVANNRGGYSIPIGEWIVYKMLSAYKLNRKLEKQRNERIWKMNSHVKELTERRVLFIGTGTIAQEAVKRLSGFDMVIAGVNTTGHAVEGFDEVHPISALETQLTIADFVIIAIPHTEKTTHLLNDAMLTAMRDDSVLINVARGAIIDEKALIKHLEFGKFASVSLDVVESEPLAEDHPFWQFEQVDITPHNSWISEKRNDRRFDIIYRNMKAYIEGTSLYNIVNFERGY
ncbi:phosphoglycerate dehydrogenase [Fusibacter paucivorans]|uniref:Phosphoglycerate dehydrogenase n=1 Tax=Fusibacter paucivorans TaxID=76009 RepID=A0ABS5PK09_9FIRM|nr:phosphoglycerate dehydrogenase [Fusibacter paucivorans]MBS7525490.1 phosphoglycerate dehydrogenase [Fusibacter paucivorans]